MYLVKVETKAPYDLFHTWCEEIHDVALAEQEFAYVAFADGEDSYLLLQGERESYVGFVNDRSATPVHCYPPVDMSMTSLGELFGPASSGDYPDAVIDDVTLGDAIDATTAKSEVVCPSIYDDEIKYICMFDNLAFPNVSTSTLRSYINQIIVEKGYGEVLFSSYAPKKHTRLELESEMMKCNRNMYMAYKQKKIKSMLNVIVSNSRSKSEAEHGISGLVYEILCEGVVGCTNTTWCFVDGMWEENSSDGYIWNFLTTQFIDFLMSEEADTIALHIMSVTIRSRIMKDIKLRLQDDSFYDRLDSKKHLIRMRNGVYNTETMVLSEPVPSDYVSVKAGVPYQVFDDESYKVQKLLSILGTIFPDQDLLDFFILSCSTFLEGYNSPKVFYVWWGEGNNAKSLVQTLVMKTFGDYCSTAPTSLVTGKRTESSNATPELCHIEKKLVVFLQEPNPEERIKAGKIKEMTGNDSMYVRQLFKSGKTMTLKAKIVIVCNNIMEIPGMDAAIRRRIVVLPFISTFLDAAEYTNRERKGNLEPHSNIIDLKIEKDLMNCRSAFMYLLCRRYNEWANYSNMSLDLPDVIRKATEDYVTRNNYPLRFIRAYIHRVEGNVVGITDIYEMYKEWFRRSYPSKKVEDLERFAKELSDEGFKDDGRGMIFDVFPSYSGDL